MAREKKLTARQRAFVAEYLVDLCAAKAAIRAGFSARNATRIGAELLGKTHVAAEIAAAMNARSERTEITQDRVLRELARIGFLDIRRAFNPDGSLKPLDQLDDDTVAAIAGIEVSEMRDRDGVVVGAAKKIRLVDKLGALTKLAQHLGMLDPKLMIKGDNQNPLQMLIQSVQGSSFKPIRLVGGNDGEKAA